MTELDLKTELRVLREDSSSLPRTQPVLVGIRPFEAHHPYSPEKLGERYETASQLSWPAEPARPAEVTNTEWVIGRLVFEMHQAKLAFEELASLPLFSEEERVTRVPELARLRLSELAAYYAWFSLLGELEALRILQLQDEPGQL